MISLGFAAFFLWLALRGQDFIKIREAFLQASLLPVFAASFFAILAYWFRAARWNLLLEPLNFSIATGSAFWSISFGYLINLTIPRFGEVARATALYGAEKVPVDQSFGTIILERVVDFLCMLSFLALTFVFKYDAILSFYQKSGITIHPAVIFAAILVLIFGIFIFFKFKNHFAKNPLAAKIISFIDGIFQGLGTIFKLKKRAKFILYTLGIWGSYFLSAYLICFALSETRNFTIPDGFFILVVGTFGMMVPASGGIGAFNLAMKYGFAALFLAMGKSAESGGEIGLVYSFISLAQQLVVTLVLGLISIPTLARLRTKKVLENR